MAEKPAITLMVKTIKLLPLRYIEEYNESD